MEHLYYEQYKFPGNQHPVYFYIGKDNLVNNFQQYFVASDISSSVRILVPPWYYGVRKMARYSIGI